MKLELSILVIVSIFVVVVLAWVVKKIFNNQLDDDIEITNLTGQCINLIYRPERRYAMTLKLNKAGILKHITFFDAINATNIPHSIIKNKPDVKIGRLGCWLSHYNIWKNHINNNNKNDILFVLEDDAVFVENFKQILQTVLSDLSSSQFIHDEWDFCFLGRLILDANCKDTIVPDTQSPLVKINCDFYQMHAYLVNPKSISKLLDMFDLENNPDTCGTIDVYMTNYIMKGKILAYATDTNIVEQAYIGSDTEAEPNI